LFRCRCRGLPPPDIVPDAKCAHPLVGGSRGYRDEQIGRVTSVTDDQYSEVTPYLEKRIGHQYEIAPIEWLQLGCQQKACVPELARSGKHGRLHARDAGHVNEQECSSGRYQKC
jgi:hypothetical protein